MSERLTDRLVKKLAPPENGNCITYDGEAPGFGCTTPLPSDHGTLTAYDLSAKDVEPLQ